MRADSTVIVSSQSSVLRLVHDSQTTRCEDTVARSRAVDVGVVVAQETPVERVGKPEGLGLDPEQWMAQAAAIVWQIVQLRNEVKAGISAVEQLRTEVRELHDHTRDELSRQAGETRQLILQTRQEMRVLQEHSLSRITSRLSQR
jgi:hypothetical protein